jgi:transposase
MSGAQLQADGIYRVRAEYRRGYSVENVAARLGLTPIAVWQTLHQLGEPMRPKGRPPLPEEALRRVARMSGSGMSATEIAAATGLTVANVYRRLAKARRRLSAPC